MWIAWGFGSQDTKVYLPQTLREMHLGVEYPISVKLVGISIRLG